MRGEIPKAEQLEEQVFSITDADSFKTAALAVYCFQYHNNAVYQQYSNLLKKSPENVLELDQIPFLPISFFKTHAVQAGAFQPEVIFESSGTTGSIPSRHLVKKKTVYERSFQKGFETFYGKPQEYCILGLLPSYLERGSSSLVYMVNNLIEESGHPQSGFYLYNHQQLSQTLLELEGKRQKTLLIGVTYALLDFAEQFPMPLQHTIIMETGGMKGRKKELVRDEVHSILKDAFKVDYIHSEYGMTELLSQAYAKANGVFTTPPWMQVLLREEDDPLSYLKGNRNGGINVIDLANIYSCSFIATEDSGRLTPEGFTVLGRFDHAEVRGCSLMSL